MATSHYFVLRAKKIITFSLGLLILFGHAANSQVTVEVITDRYILPIAELASTQTDPDVIVMTNSDLHLTLVPNRGRIFAELSSREGPDFLSFHEEPDPFRGPDGVETVEFGGFYASVPWNMRVRQPYNLSYEIIESGPQRAEVAITGQDILTRVAVEWRISIVEEEKSIEAVAVYTNESSQRAQTIDLANFLHLNRTGEGRVRRKLLAPFETMEVVDSEGDWLGPAGEQLRVDEIERDWRADGDYCVRAAIEPSGDAIAWFDRGSREALRWQWGTTGGFSEITICRRDDQIRVETHSPTFTLEPGESKSISQRFDIVEQLRRNPDLEETEQ